MNENKINALVASVIGAINFTLVVYVFVVPEDIRQSAAVAYTYQAENPIVYSLAWFSFTIMAMLSFYIIPLVWKEIKKVNENVANTAAVFGIVGYAVLGVWSMTLTASVYKIAGNFVEGDEFTKKAILALGYQEIDPSGWFTFGAIGTWYILANLLLLKSKILSKTHSVIGILLGAGHWLTVFGALLDNEPLNMVASVAGLLFYPSWYFWLGAKMYRGEFA